MPTLNEVNLLEIFPKDELRRWQDKSVDEITEEYIPGKMEKIVEVTGSDAHDPRYWAYAVQYANTILRTGR